VQQRWAWKDKLLGIAEDIRGEKSLRREYEQRRPICFTTLSQGVVTPLLMTRAAIDGIASTKKNQELIFVAQSLFTLPSGCR
jgi:hypothetical protein